MKASRDGDVCLALSGSAPNYIVTALGCADAAQRVDRAARSASGCGDLDVAASKVNGVEMQNIGAMLIDEIDPTYRSIFVETKENNSAPTIRLSGDRAAKVFICSRESSGSDIPDRDNMENRLREQQIALLAERYLRDIKRDATIIRR